jgi:hypothetical protein
MLPGQKWHLFFNFKNRMTNKEYTFNSMVNREVKKLWPIKKSQVFLWPIKNLPLVFLYWREYLVVLVESTAKALDDSMDLIGTY